MSEEKKITSIVSGIQPSGRPHIGNYFGAMKQFFAVHVGGGLLKEQMKKARVPKQF
jgi:tryptophanyl-tRNA synthetase